MLEFIWPGSENQMANHVKLEAKLNLDPTMPEDPRSGPIAIHAEGRPVGFVSSSKLPDHVLLAMRDGKKIDLGFSIYVDLEEIDWETGGLKA